MVPSCYDLAAIVLRNYVGHLDTADPLHAYLAYEILPQMGLNGDAANFRVFAVKGNKVYLYEEKHSGARVLGKFFGAGAHRMHREFNNLEHLRSHGLDGYPHHVVRPLGANAALNGVLVEEYCPGSSLSSIINGAIYQGAAHRLFGKLTALAWFLATMHNRTANGQGVDFTEDCDYLDQIIARLRSKQIIGTGDADEFYWLRERWRDQPRMWEDQQVLAHGDATPSNFLFGEGMNVIAIDLERMRRADRAFDLGRIAGELQYFFLQANRSKDGAEPFIGHFLWEYACHFPDRDRAFHSITSRLPFQMGLTLLRIARNAWVGAAHRQRLIEEAKIILRTFQWT